MRQKDVALIIIIVFISGIASFFVSNALFASSSSRQQQVEVVEAISSNFNAPSAKYFNNQSINPTVLIQIGNNSNPNLFNGASQ